MGFVKVVKSKSYYKRYQVKFRRRRQCKTDYYARKRLIWMDKNKYNTPKYRLVVRFSNRDVIAAIVSSDIKGDRIIQTAYGHELSKYGLKFGFNNYASTYATGLLVARRANAHFKLPFLGSKDATDKYFNVADGDVADDSGKSVEEKRPFKAILDVGLHCTTTGARLFAAVKGACDGGINVPHSPTRFPGVPQEKDAEVDYELLKKYIYAGHVADYMNYLKEEDTEKYNAHFSVAIKNGINAEDLEGIYQGIHDKIRAESADKLLTKGDAKRLGFFKTRTAAKPAKYEKKFFNTKKLTIAERKKNISTKLNKITAYLNEKKANLAAMSAANDASDSE